MHNYKLKRTKSSKAIKIRVHPNGDVVVLAGQNTPMRTIDNFVTRNSDWITSQLSLFDWSRLGKWSVKYLDSEADIVSLESATETILVYGSDISRYSDQRVSVKLYDELRRRVIAKETSVRKLSDSLDLRINNISVKNNSTNWGSCSSNRNINLSAYLAILPDELSEYVISHEIAHLKHMNHSKEFWQFLGTFCAQPILKRRRMKEYSKYLGVLKTDIS